MACAVRRGITISVMALCVAILPAVPAQATSGHRWRTLTIHQAWVVTVTGAHHVAEHAGSSGHALGEGSDTVQPQSACVRHSPYEVDCPFTYFVGFVSAEAFERCRDTGQVTEVAEQRFRFKSLKPRCQLIVNKTP